MRLQPLRGPLDGGRFEVDGTRLPLLPPRYDAGGLEHLMCFDTAWREIGNWRASSFTVASPPTSRSTIARRVGSPNA